MVELWLVDLRESAAALEVLEHQTPRLSCDDRRRAMRAGDRREQRLRLAAYSALRVALERLRGRGVRRRAYRRNGQGAPSLPGIPARFTLSHTDGVALIGVTQLRAIGVDVEKARRVCVSERRRQEILAAGAGIASRKVPGASMDRRFLQAWARLEAYAKARGLGIGRLLEDLQLRGSAHRTLSLESITALARQVALARPLRVIDLTLPNNLLGAVALAPSARLPQLRRFPSDIAAVRRLLTHAGRGARVRNAVSTEKKR